MSRYRGNGERCPVCGLAYGELRTGLCYRDVWLFFWTPPGADSSEWRYKRRGTVLGAWHQHKRELWDQHLETCVSVPTVDVSEARSLEAWNEWQD